MPEESRRKGAPARILLAEDDLAYGGALKELLERDGHEVRHVADGESAIELLRKEGDRFTLVLTDLLLPRKTGFEIARAVNDLELCLPILAMTGLYDDVREIHALRGLGVRGWIHKSAPFEHVLFRVNSLAWPQSRNDRQGPRVAVSLPVQFRTGERVHYATSYNLSATGIYVRTPEPVEAGTIADIALTLPTAGEMLTMRAEVVHSASVEDVRGTAYPAGFGARFASMSPLVAAALRHFVDRMVADEGSAVAPAGDREAPAPAGCC